MSHGGDFFLPVFSRLSLLLEIVEQDLAANLVCVGVGLNDVFRVGRADHVVVEIKSDLVCLFWLQLRAVVKGANETTPIFFY